MSKLGCLAACLLVCAATPAVSQDDGHAHHADHRSPYADLQPSGIAALSLQEVEELRSGAGMGLARAAELNRYPGPKHVLELAERLRLSAEQRSEVERIRLAMRQAAERLGAAVLDKEATLDRRFAHRHIDETTLRALTSEIAALRGELRFVHLRAHLQTASTLTTEQIDAYDILRGYREDGS